MSMSSKSGKNRRTALTTDDKKVWKAVTRNVVPRQADVTGTEAETGSSSGRGTLSKPTIGAAKPAPDKAEKRQGAERRASRDELLDLVADHNRQAKTHPQVQLTSQAGPALTPGAVRDIDRRTATRLKQGRLPIEGRLDLHGMIRDTAFQAVQGFVQSSALNGKRCVILVTGKGLGQRGGGVLRNEVPQWLNLPANRKYIISFTYAQPKDGGTGALYIYLRRPDRIQK